MGDDLFHRIFEIAGLVTLASAVVHIRPAIILSNPSDYGDMFSFCISLTASQFLMLLRFAELYHLGIGEGSIMKNVGLIEAMVFSVTFSCCVAASIVAGIEYYGEDEDADKHRMLAEEASGNTSTAQDYPYEADPYPYVETAETTDVPIWLCLSSFLAFHGINTIRICFFWPRDGSHKKLSKFFFARRPLHILIALPVDLFLPDHFILSTTVQLLLSMSIL